MQLPVKKALSSSCLKGAQRSTSSQRDVASFSFGRRSTSARLTQIWAAIAIEADGVTIRLHTCTFLEELDGCIVKVRCAVQVGGDLRAMGLALEGDWRKKKCKSTF
jgi:hypothetical protein